MIFPTLIVKSEFDKFRIINIENESEAIIDLDIFNILVSISKKRADRHFKTK